MKRSKQKAKSLGKAPTMTAAASLTGLPYDVVSAAKEAGCAAFRARGDVDCDILLQFVRDHPEITQKAAASIDILEEEALKMKADRETKEFKLAVMKREFIPVSEVKRTFTRSVIAAKSKAITAEKTIGMEARMKLGLNDDQANSLTEIVTKHNRQWMTELARGDWGKCACANCGSEQ